MPHYIVIDEDKKAHIVEANTYAQAIAQIPKGETVRLARVEERLKAEEKREG